MGRVSSIETMGLVDGPGIRAVIFLAGCKLRCLYCHNPESWNISGGEEMSASLVVKKICRLKPYFERSGGGVTISGGEPLLQPEFLTELLSGFRNHGIHTAIDTAGVGFEDYDKILSLTDLVLYDVKATDSISYEKICRADIKRSEAFLRALKKSGVPTVVRQVVVPGFNDSDEYMRALKDYIKEYIPTAISVELLPYHTLGAHKYRELGIPQPLDGLPQMDQSLCKELWQRHFADFGKKENG